MKFEYLNRVLVNKDNHLSGITIDATASLFDTVLHRQDTTPPDSLVMRIIQPKHLLLQNRVFSMNPFQYRNTLRYQHEHGHENLLVAGRDS